MILRAPAPSRYGKPTWTLRRNPGTGKNEWVRPGTGEVDSSAPRHDLSQGLPGVVVGARPRPGEKCHKPSEELLRQLNAVQDETRKENQTRKRERFNEIDRDFETGKRKMDKDVHLGVPTVAVPTENGAVRYVVADKVPEDVQARLAASRRQAAEEIAKAKSESNRARPEGASFEGRFENTIPAAEPRSASQFSLMALDPATARNDAKRIWS